METSAPATLRLEKSEPLTELNVENNRTVLQTVDVEALEPQQMKLVTFVVSGLTERDMVCVAAETGEHDNIGSNDRSLAVVQLLAAQPQILSTQVLSATENEVEVQVTGGGAEPYLLIAAAYRTGRMVDAVQTVLEQSSYSEAVRTLNLKGTGIDAVRVFVLRNDSSFVPLLEALIPELK